MTEGPPAPMATELDQSFVYYVLRYVPDLLRDEWINIGVLAFDPQTGERRFRLIEEEQEFARVRRLHPAADETVLRALQENLYNRFEAALAINADDVSNAGTGVALLDWPNIVAKWDAALSNTLQLSSAHATRGADLDSEIDRLYISQVAVRRRVQSQPGLVGGRANLRRYCADVFWHARLWHLLEKRVRVAEYTFPGDPMRVDFGYRRNGVRGFVQTLSVSRSPGDAKLLAYTAKRIQDYGRFASEFTVVTDVSLLADSARHRFVRDTLQDSGVTPVPREGFAVWVAKLRPMLLQ